MKLRNRIFALILLCAMLACLAACGGKESKSDTVYELKLDCMDPSTSIIATGLERFKTEVEEKSAGRIKINIFYGSTLGGRRNLLLWDVYPLEVALDPAVLTDEIQRYGRVFCKSHPAP